jgi:hypothetical protein
MKGFSDQWIKDRILWAAKRNSLPMGMTSIYDDSQNLPESLRLHAHLSGIPVLVLVSGEDLWTVLGSQRIVTMEKGHVKTIDLESIADIDMPSESKQGQKKMECHSLLIDDKSGVKNQVWAPAGREFFAIWNILRRLKNLLNGMTSKAT